MASTTSVNSANSAVYDALNTKSTTAGASTADEVQDRFLTLLVTQMQNQDPMNPLSNDQLTTQMAQINTVGGIEKLNSSISSLTSQFGALQTMMGASLVGKQVTVPGSKLLVEGGTGSGSFELSSTADKVKVEILNAAGTVIGTKDLGALAAGTHDFDWAATGMDASSGLSFRVSAASGKNAVTTTALMRDTVESVLTSGGTLKLDLKQAGTVEWSDVTALN